MVQNKSFKIRIYPNSIQEQQINNNIGSARFVFNHFLNMKIEKYKTKESLSYNNCSSELTKLKKLEDYVWLKQSDSTSLQQSLKDLDIAYSNFFKGLKKTKQVGFPKFKSKHKAKLSYRITMSINIVNNNIKLPKLGLIKSNHSFDLTQITKINNATVSKSRSGKYFVSLSCEVDVKVKHSTNKQVGIDLGIKELATLSDGTVINNPKYYRQYENKLAKQQRKFSKMKKGSNNREKQRIKVAKLHEKITNCRVDYIHKFTNNLVSNYDTIVIEDLNVSGMIKNHKLAKSIADASFFEIRRQLEYKCNWYGKELVIINRFYPSSKTCSCCGSIKQDLTLADREYICNECGLIIDRDLNASINILTVGITGIA
jgi:putative transposase